jgi:hypothetical protein
LISALFLTLQHPMALSNTFIRSFPSKWILHWHGNNFQTAVSERARANRMF